MAINSSFSTQIPIQKYGSYLKIASRDLMAKSNHVSMKKEPLLSIRLSTKFKAFEDEAEGIVCYKDENGELICEGYDEGPRLSQMSRPSCQFRDVEIMNMFLQKGWLQIVQGEEITQSDDGVYVKEDLNCNGFNKSC